MRVFILFFAVIFVIGCANSAEKDPHVAFLDRTMAQIRTMGITITGDLALQVYYEYQQHDLMEGLEKLADLGVDLTVEQKQQTVAVMMGHLNDVLNFEKDCLQVILQGSPHLYGLLLEDLTAKNLIGLLGAANYTEDKPVWERFLSVVNGFVNPIFVLHINYNTYLRLDSPVYLRNAGRAKGYLADYTSFFYQHFLELATLSFSAAPYYHSKKAEFAEPIKGLRFSPTNERVGERIDVLDAALKQYFNSLDSARIDVMMTRLALKMIRHLVFFGNPTPPAKPAQSDLVPYITLLSEPAFSHLDEQAYRHFHGEAERADEMIRKYTEGAARQATLIFTHQKLNQKHQEYYLLYRMHMMHAMLSEPTAFEGLGHALRFQIFGRWLGMVYGENTEHLQTNKMHWGGNLTYNEATSDNNPFALEMSLFYENRWRHSSEAELIQQLKKKLLLVPDGDHTGVGVLLKGYEKLRKLPVYSGRNRREGERAIKSVLAYDRLYEIYQMALPLVYGQSGILEKASPIVTLYLIDALHLLLGEQFQNDWQNQKLAYERGQKMAQEMLIQNAINQHEQMVMARELETKEGLENFLKEFQKSKTPQLKSEKKQGESTAKSKKKGSKKKKGPQNQKREAVVAKNHEPDPVPQSQTEPPVVAEKAKSPQKKSQPVKRSNPKPQKSGKSQKPGKSKPIISNSFQVQIPDFGGKIKETVEKTPKVPAVKLPDIIPPEPEVVIEQLQELPIVPVYSLPPGKISVFARALVR